MIERKDLSYARNLKRYRENGMPWMAETLRRLPPRLDKQQPIVVLTFVSVMAMIQNGDFVSFQSLDRFISDMPVSQVQLQRAQILAPLILLHRPKVHRLHETIACKVPPLTTLPTTTNAPKRPRRKPLHHHPLTPTKKSREGSRRSSKGP